MYYFRIIKKFESENTQRQEQVLELTKILEETKKLGQPKKVKTAEKTLKKKQDSKSKSSTKLKKQRDNLEKIEIDRKNPSKLSEKIKNFETKKENKLSVRYEKIKKASTIHIYKNHNQLELILIIFLIIDWAKPNNYFPYLFRRKRYRNH